MRWLTDGIVTGKRWLEGRMSSAVKTQKITAPGYVRFRSKNADVLVYVKELVTARSFGAWWAPSRSSQSS